MFEVFGGLGAVGWESSSEVRVDNRDGEKRKGVRARRRRDCGDQKDPQGFREGIGRRARAHDRLIDRPPLPPQG